MLNQSIVRIVRMEFAPARVLDFMNHFNVIKHEIRGFDGCEHLELHRDWSEKNVCFTYSIWASEAQLNAYRDSELFTRTWAEVKQMFQGKPVVYSLLHLETVRGNG